ncbi:hypothetical protein [Methanosarcina vacuolata]|uniref:hypothetical protein n=1 Tax=Methanosarcina vacuolata TaxID=2215 RepID=UPI000A6570ED|nr:hypothetical protein [Methanosarcina vacuolata]
MSVLNANVNEVNSSTTERMMIRGAEMDWTVHPFDETKMSLKNPLGSKKMHNKLSQK